MTLDERKLLLRALLKRGVTPVSSSVANADAANKTAHRFPRGNIALQKNPPLTRKEVEAVRDRRKERLLAREHA